MSVNSPGNPWSQSEEEKKGYGGKDLQRKGFKPGMKEWGVMEWRLAGTGLCSYRVRGVDGSCAKHLTVESYTVIYAANSHTY